MVLDLEDNCVGPEGAVYIAEALVDNTYVSVLVCTNQAAALGSQPPIIQTRGPNYDEIYYIPVHSSLCRPASQDSGMSKNFLLLLLADICLLHLQNRSPSDTLEPAVPVREDNRHVDRV